MKYSYEKVFDIYVGDRIFRTVKDKAYAESLIEILKDMYNQPVQIKERKERKYS